MAQPSSRATQDIIDPTSILGSATSYLLSDTHHSSNQTQTYRPDIKEELYSNGSDGQKVDITSNSQPKKRQKTSEQGFSRKFVSQQKWKFLDGQPWPTSRLSTKAQNASQALGKCKMENDDAKRSTSPDATRYTTDASERTTCTQPSFHDDSTAQQSNSDPSKSEKRSKVPSQRPRSSAEGPSSKQHSATRGTSVISSSSRQPATNPSTSNLPQNQQIVDQGTNESPQIAGTTSTSNERATCAKTRTPRIVSTLSLEKDADRIAALISEKKRENESSRFRERMLQRRLQHRDQHEAGVDLESNSNRLVSLRESRSTTRDSSQGSEESIGTKADDLPPHIDISASQPSTSHSQTMPTAARYSHSTKRSVDNRSEAQENNSSSKPFEGRGSTSSALLRKPQAQNEHEILFGKQVSLRPLARSDHGRTNETDGFHVMVPQPRNGSGPFEAEDAETVTHLAAFTNQFLPTRSPQEIHGQHANCAQRSGSQYFGRPSSSSLTITRSQSLQRPSSTSSAKGQIAVDGVANAAPSPASLSSSHSPTSLSAQQLAHIDISAQPHHTSTYTSIVAQNRSGSTGQTPSHATPAYYSMGRPNWAFTQGAPESVMVNQVAQSVPFSAAATWNAPSRPAQQRSSSPSVLMSNSSMPDSDVRSNVSINGKKPSSKPRVNMFSNTKGTPFPMQEVIRQIEMT